MSDTGVMKTSELVFNQPLERVPDTLIKHAPAGSRVAVVCDAVMVGRHGKALVAALAAKGFEAHLLSIPSGESSKTLAQAGKLYRELAKRKFERKSWLIALGGGVTGDLCGFVAATFLRGISLAQIPTTLLAQVDASIGGKTGVDIPEGKNLVGAFYMPKFVWIEPLLLKTLPVKHWRNGLAEVIKYGAIRDAALFATLEQKMDKLVKGYSPDWNAIIQRCATIKADVVEKDPYETTGLRAILNFGHSVGHAVEAAGKYKDYLHGEAVSIGMFVASAVSEQMNLIDMRDRIRLNTLLSRAGLPAQVRKPIPRETLMSFLSRDKKSEAGAVKFVLLKKIGQASSGYSVPPEILETALVTSGL